MKAFCSLPLTLKLGAEAPCAYFSASFKQIFGPCAIPFSIEKQTLLKVALMDVVRSAFIIYSANVKQVTSFPYMVFVLRLSHLHGCLVHAFPSAEL